MTKKIEENANQPVKNEEVTKQKRSYGIGRTFGHFIVIGSILGASYLAIKHKVPDKIYNWGKETVDSLKYGSTEEGNYQRYIRTWAKLSEDQKKNIIKDVINNKPEYLAFAIDGKEDSILVAKYKNETNPIGDITADMSLNNDQKMQGIEVLYLSLEDSIRAKQNPITNMVYNELPDSVAISALKNRFGTRLGDVLKQYSTKDELLEIARDFGVAINTKAAYDKTRSKLGW